MAGTTIRDIIWSKACPECEGGRLFPQAGVCQTCHGTMAVGK